MPADEEADETRVAEIDMEGDHTLVAPPAPVALPPAAPRTVPDHPVADRTTPVGLARADELARVQRPLRQPLPPRRPPATRRGVGGMVVWGLVIAVLLGAGLWGWSELQRADGFSLVLPGPDTLGVEPEDTVVLPDPRAEAYLINLDGWNASRDGRYEDAVDYFRQAVEIAPDVYDFRRNYGLTLFRLGRFVEAESELRQAIELDPSEALGYENLARTRLARGDTTEAIRLYREYVRRETNPLQRQRATRYIEEWEAAMNPAIDLIGEPIDRPQPGDPFPAGDTVAAPMPPSARP